MRHLERFRDKTNTEFRDDDVLLAEACAGVFAFDVHEPETYAQLVSILYDPNTHSNSSSRIPLPSQPGDAEILGMSTAAAFMRSRGRPGNVD